MSVRITNYRVCLHSLLPFQNMNHVVKLLVIKLRSSVDFMVGIFSTKGYKSAKFNVLFVL